MTIGSSKTADVRLLGEQVGGIHAIVQFANDQWTIADTGTGGGTWIQREAILEKPLDHDSVVRIGDHELHLVTQEFERTLFNETSEGVANGTIYHQILIRQQGLLLETHTLKKNEAFRYFDGQKWLQLPPPADFAWHTHKVGQVEICQRLVGNEHHIHHPELNIRTLFSPEFRGPVTIGLVAMLLLTLAILFAPNSPNGQLQTVVIDNPYSKMIFDSKLTKQLRRQSQQISKQMNQMKESRAAGEAGSGVEKPKENSANATTTRVVRNLQAAGLSALVGKISKRASRQAILIQTTGASVNDGAMGPALGNVGGVAKQTGNASTSGATGSYKLGGVGTIGKGGGQNLKSGLGGLGEGGVGSGQVGFVEEEGEVEGGLDRDVIARYIKTQLGQIRYCYERQLSASPDLYGKIQVKFVISPSGAVSQQNIGTSTLKNAMIEGCILRRVASWKFPEPKKGTSVLVTYPFLFKSTN
jgi:hypothetical protein